MVDWDDIKHAMSSGQDVHNIDDEEEDWSIPTICKKTPRQLENENRVFFNSVMMDIASLPSL